MTMLRQLAAVIITLFVLLFAGTILISAHDARSYLNTQLKIVSQDTATSLGLSLSPHMAANEMAIVTSMTDAIFDSGYYREVSISSMDGKTILKRVAPDRIEGVPSWFVRLLPLDAPRGEALIMAGWQQAGVVSVAANPGQAYITLWNNSINALWWFVGALSITFALGMLALHFVLRPLRIVEQQAKAICDREYPVQKKLPWTLELRSVVVAMNRMTSKIKEMFEEQTAAIERLRAESYRDALTGLANRPYFDMYLQQMTDSKEEIETGALIFVELKGFKALNERRGYAAGDALLRETAHIIGDVCKGSGVSEYIAAHLAGANFAVVLSNAGEREAAEVGERIAYALPLLRERGLIDAEEIGHVGIALYRGQTQRQLLTEADMALRAAQAKGANAVQMHVAEVADGQAVYTATHWTEFLSGVLKNNNIQLHMQPVLDCGDRQSLLQHEALLRITGEDGKLIPAGIFAPMAKRLGLIQKFDKLVVNEVLARLAAGRYGQTTVAVNLSPSTLQDPAFVDWLSETLRAAPEASRRIAFEVSEYGALEDLDRLRATVLRLRDYGAKFGIDHFGRGFSSFGYLATLKIDYLKIDGSYVRGIDQNKDNQFLVGSVAKIAHGLDLTVVAESVETAAEWQTLHVLGVNAVQGYGVGMPENI